MPAPSLPRREPSACRVCAHEFPRGELERRAGIIRILIVKRPYPIHVTSSCRSSYPEGLGSRVINGGSEGNTPQQPGPGRTPPIVHCLPCSENRLSAMTGLWQKDALPPAFCPAGYIRFREVCPLPGYILARERPFLDGSRLGPPIDFSVMDLKRLLEAHRDESWGMVSDLPE